jgi:putative ABC transport system ATP-binding protein
MAVWRGKNLGVVFQFFQLLPMISIIDNLLLPMDLCNKFPANERFDRAMNILRLLDMEAYAHKMPGELGGGQQQSVAVARALANDPPIIAADEPTGNLDSNTANVVFHLFEELVKRGKTIIMVTHDPSLANRTSRTVLLCDGEVIHPLVAQALSSLPHRVMLELTKKLQAETFHPGEVLIREEEEAGFYLVESGTLELVSLRAGGREKHLVKVDHGQYINRLDIQAIRENEKDANLFIRAAQGEPVRVLKVTASEFTSILTGLPAISKNFLRRGLVAHSLGDR